LRNYLEVDVEAITKELKDKGIKLNTLNAAGKQKSWMGRMPGKDQRLDGQDHLKHYEGDFKRRKRHAGCDCDL
jgi:alkaline phosphatase